METQATRVLLVDDHPSILRVFAFALEREPDMTVAGQARTLHEARRIIAEHTPIDVALLDLELPDGSGLDLIHELCAANPGCHVVIFSGNTDDRMRAYAVEAGASAVLDKTMDIPDVIGVIRRLRQGEPAIPPTEAIALLREAIRLRERERAARAALAQVTPREHEVLQALAEGLSDKELAARLGVSQRTAQAHVANLLGKLGVDSRMQALLLAARLGVVQIR
jgi:DNA-binding NarL/FixJ family response regulator